MNALPRTLWFEDAPDERLFEQNRIANRCFGGRLLDPPPVRAAWGRAERTFVQHDSDYGRVYRRCEFADPNPGYRFSTNDPVETALYVVTHGEGSSLLSYVEHRVEDGIEDGIAVIRREIAPVLKQLEAELASRSTARQRAHALVQDVLQRLRQKSAAEVEISAEDAWESVDFSALYDEE
jgi:hypothetical protein